MEVKLETYNKLATIIDNEDGLTVESMQRLSLATNSLVRLAESEDAEQIPYQLYYDIEDKLSAKEADVETLIALVQSKLDEVTGNEALAYTVDAVDSINSVNVNALAPYNGVIGTDTKQQQENLVFSTTVGNEYKLADTTRFRKVDGKVFEICPELVTNGELYIGSNTNYDNSIGINNLTNTTTYKAWVSENYTTVVGKTYRLKVVPYSGAFRVLVGSNAGSGSVLIGGVGVYEFSFVATDTLSYITLENSSSVSGASFSYYDNISVKEIQTLDFSRAGEHPFEVYPTTDLTAPNEVLEGDYVVVENENLVTNGTFDTDTSGWSANNAILSLESNRLRVTDNGSSSTAYQVIQVNPNVEYVFSVEAIVGNDTGGSFAIMNGDFAFNGSNDLISELNFLGLKTYTFTPTNNIIRIEVYSQNPTTGKYTDFDNVSVKLANDTYRATRDSSEMYDYDDTLNGVVDATTTSGIIYCTGNNTAGTVGHYYLATFNGVTNPSLGTLNSSSYIDLGTASTMSLQNPYFETRDYISNQILAMQKSDGTIHTETLLVDAYAVETTNAILIKNSWTKLENGLYSKGDVVASPIGYWQTLNPFGYHPVYNPMGCIRFARYETSTVGGESNKWYESSVFKEATNVWDTVTKSNAGGSMHSTDSTSISSATGGVNYGRPDSKFYDIIYTDQFIDLRTNAEKANIPQLLNEVESGAVNGSLKGCSDLVGMEQVTQTTTGTVDTLEVGTKLKYTVGDVLQIWDGTNPYRRFVVSVDGTTITMDSTIVKTAIPFIIGGGKLPITSFGTSLTTDIIGAP